MRKNIKFYPYIDDIAYNEFELKEEVWYGNGTHVHYAYDTLQRLDTLRSYDGLDSLMQDIHYTYDSVGNITDIENYAPVLPNGLGGPYSHHHDYDSFYRIEHSEGWWGQTPLSYTLDMEYHDNGRIQRKTLSSDTWLEGVLASMNYDNAYHYTNPLQPNTLAYIGNGPQQTFEWDAKRNLTYHWNDMTRLKRYLGWDEENRLTSYSKGNTRAFYRYDAQGERFYKNTGDTTAYGNPTLYASPYLVAAGNEYTKHYYIEDERFACRIGDGAFPDIDSAVVSNALLSAKQLEVNDAALDSIVPNQFDFLRTRQGQWSSQHTTYWQHSDHLGSASWITDTSGCAVQHLQYMPWGEPLLDYRNSSFNTRYTFSGKERDEETGYSYFGARYYNSTYSIWMSIDPMSDKYPSISPYAYCGDNPVKLVDQDGKEIGDYYNIYGNYIGTDGIDDGKKYIVTGKPNGSPYANPRMQYSEDEIHRIPSSKEARQEIVDKLKGFDKANPNAEWGGLYGVGINPYDEANFGKESNHFGQPSDAGDPSLPDSKLSYTQLDVKDIGINGFYAFFDYHTHGSGGWEQEPSNFFDSESNTWKGDIPNARQRQSSMPSFKRTFAVFAMEIKQVYFYNGEKTCGAMPFDSFINLGN
jgi:RHS repeat-associated protein